MNRMPEGRQMDNEQTEDKDTQDLIPGTVKVTLFGKKNFTNVIKFDILRGDS